MKTFTPLSKWKTCQTLSLKKMNYEIIPAGNVKQPLSGTQAEKVIGKCLRINPAERYQTLHELRTALNELRED